MGDVVLVTGGRDYRRADVINRALSHFTQVYLRIGRPLSNLRLRHGGARGVDTLCGQWALSKGLIVQTFKPDWDRYGRSAGIRRNTEMLLTEPVPFYLISFPGGRGTKHMTESAEDLGLPVWRVT
jgi:hypothetical protein